MDSFLVVIGTGVHRACKFDVVLYSNVSALSGDMMFIALGACMRYKFHRWCHMLAGGRIVLFQHGDFNRDTHHVMVFEINRLGYTCLCWPGFAHGPRPWPPLLWFPGFTRQIYKNVCRVSLLNYFDTGCIYVTVIHYASRNAWAQAVNTQSHCFIYVVLHLTCLLWFSSCQTQDCWFPLVTCYK